METNGQLRIFLIDDEKYCLHLYTRYLEALGFTQVQSFSDSAESLNQLTLKPDLIFLDYNMDNLNGIDILRKIKRFDPNILVVFISGQEDINIAVNALKYGALDYITKDTFDAARIKLCLEKVLQIREMIRNKRKRSRVTKILSGAGLLSVVYFIQKAFANL